MITRPESRQFLNRTKLHLPGFRESLSQSQAIQSLNSNRSSYSSSHNRSSNLLLNRKSIGNAEVNKLQLQPYNNVNTSLPNSQHQKNNIHTSHNLQNHIPSFGKQNMHGYNTTQLSNLVSEINSLTERVCVLESVQKFEQQKILFNAKKLVEQAFQENSGAEHRKLLELQKKLSEKNKDIQQIRNQVKKIDGVKINNEKLEEVKESIKKELEVLGEKMKEQFGKVTSKVDSLVEAIQGYCKKEEMSSFKKDFEKKMLSIQAQAKQPRMRSIQKGNPISLTIFQLTAKILTTKQNQKRTENENEKIVIEQINEVYKIDKEGFLMDSENRYLLDNRNYMIRIDQAMMNKLDKLGVVVAPKPK